MHNKENIVKGLTIGYFVIALLEIIAEYSITFLYQSCSLHC